MNAAQVMAERVAMIDRPEPDDRPSRLDDLLAAVDAVLECQLRHQRAHRVLQEATHHFELVDAEWQAQLGSLQRRLLVLVQALHSRTEEAAQPPPAHGSLDPPRPGSEVPVVLPSLSITCFGHFQVMRAGRPVELCRNRNGRTILRYLVAQPRHRATMDALMESLWPADPPHVARHKLHCAFSALRLALNDSYVSAKGGGYLLYENGTYMINPAVGLRIDAEELMAAYRAGQRTGGPAAVEHYEAACRLYTGPYLVEDLYADWSLLQREQLMQTYLAMCRALADHHLVGARFDEAVRWASRAIEANRCEEVAYRQLMRGHAGAGRRDEALRQYYRCQQVLAEELGVQPMHRTMALYHAILRGEAGPLASGAESEPDQHPDLEAGVEPT